MASLYSTVFIYVCISLLLPSHVAKYYATTAYASCENSRRTDFITRCDRSEPCPFVEFALTRLVIE